MLHFWKIHSGGALDESPGNAPRIHHDLLVEHLRACLLCDKLAQSETAYVHLRIIYVVHSFQAL